MNPNSFLNSYSHLVRHIRCAAIKERNANVALSLAWVYGDFRWFNHDGVYQDAELENKLQVKVLESKLYSPPYLYGNSNVTIVLATELYNQGGHSAVAVNWMNLFSDEKNHKLVVTRSIDYSIINSLVEDKVDFHLCSSKGVQLINEILACAALADRIVLHIHPSDIESAIAAKILQNAGKKIFFYNHADHAFSYGISCSNIVCEISAYGVSLRNRSKRVGIYSFLGIPISFRTFSKKISSDGKGALGSKIVSCGSAYKYAPDKVFFGDFIDDLLLCKPDATVSIVGPTGKEPWWCANALRWGDSVQFLGVLPHDEYVKVLQSADVYVDSFPLTGGTAFPEALLNGILVTGLQHSVQGYSPADELKVENIKQLTERVVKLLNKDIVCVETVLRVKENVEYFHSLNRFYENVNKLYNGIVVANNEIKVNVDTFWIEKKWIKSQEIIPPTWSSFRSMPMSARLKILLELSKVFNYTKFINIAKLILFTLISPKFLRKCLQKL